MNSSDPAVLLVDGYKVGHVKQYPAGTQYVYSNLTARKGMNPEGTGVVFFGLQYFMQRYLVQEFNARFFARTLDDVMTAYKRRIDTYLGPGAVSLDHIEALHDLGHLPLRIKSLPEGAHVPYGVPMLTIENTHKDHAWLTNAVETLMSSVLWKACTSATSALNFRRTFNEFSKKTVGEKDPFLAWQGHDFSFRGMSGPEDAALSGAAHLLSFTGTDTIPAIDFLERYYGANADDTLIGGSVPATEHSVMCAGGFEDERETFRRLICDVYPSGIVSIVSDTWDLWNVLTNIVPSLKAEIMARDGKVVIRPDSGDPSNIINGDMNYPEGTPQRKGALRLLDETFGSTNTAQGYKTLDPHVGLIYGDSITPKRQRDILDRMEFNGYASNNIVLGIGSYNYQYTTRDVHGFAMKATHVVNETRGAMPIFKAPKTGAEKNSAKGLLRVDWKDGAYRLTDNVTRDEERKGELQTAFLDGEIVAPEDLGSIRNLVAQEFDR